MYIDSKLTARRGKLKVLIIARISGANQDPRSLLAQEEYCRKFVRDHFAGEIEFVTIASRGSGEWLDREELVRAEELVESGAFDLVIAEDLGRIMRRTRAVDFCEVCEDCKTRVIAINDGLDTLQKKWRRNALFAAMKHEESNEDTSDRLKRQMDHNFERDGGCVNHVVWGLVKPAGCAGDKDLCWDPAARRLLRAAWWKLERQSKQSIVAIAHWVRSKPGGEGLSTKQFRRLIVNPIVTGVRRRGMRRSIRKNKNGHRRGEAAEPEQMKTRYCAHLRIIAPARFERVKRLRAEQNACFKRGADGVDPCKGRPKADTRFPGQAMTCGICGRYFCWGGHGRTGYLMCAGARDYRCWNTTTVYGALAARRIAEAVIAKVTSLADFDQTFAEMLRARAGRAGEFYEKEGRELEARGRRIEREIAHLKDAVRRSGANAILLEEADRLDAERKGLEFDRDQWKRRGVRKVTLPAADVLRQRAKESFSRLLESSEEVPDLVRKLLPTIELHPHRLCDGGGIVQRAELRLSLVPLVPGLGGLDDVVEMLCFPMTLDLFDPPQREAIRPEVLAAIGRRPRLSSAAVAQSLGPRHGYVTATAVQHALKLARQMEERRLPDPYVRVVEPPSDCGRNRMHRHPDYRFEPLAGFRSMYAGASAAASASVRSDDPKDLGAVVALAASPSDA